MGKNIGFFLLVLFMSVFNFALGFRLGGRKESGVATSKKAKSEWVAFNERAIGVVEGTGRKVCVRVREVIYVLGDGKGSVLFLRGETEAIGVCEDVEVVMARLST